MARTSAARLWRLVSSRGTSAADPRSALRCCRSPRWTRRYRVIRSFHSPADLFQHGPAVIAALGVHGRNFDPSMATSSAPTDRSCSSVTHGTEAGVSSRCDGGTRRWSEVRPHRRRSHSARRSEGSRARDCAMSRSRFRPYTYSFSRSPGCSSLPFPPLPPARPETPPDRAI